MEKYIPISHGFYLFSAPLTAAVTVGYHPMLRRAHPEGNGEIHRGPARLVDHPEPEVAGLGQQAIERDVAAPDLFLMLSRGIDTQTRQF